MTPVRIALSLVLALAAVARADVPSLVVSHQGFLLDAGDHAVVSPALGFEFRVYTTLRPQDDETAVWASGACALQVSHGTYAALLGAGSGATGGCGAGLSATMLPAGQVRYLEVRIEGVALSPRLRLADVPNAVNAQFATVSADTQQLMADLKSATGAVNTTGLVHWNQLAGVPAGLADGTDDGNSYTADGASLQLVGSTFSVKAAGIGADLLASDPLAIAKVSGGALSIGGGDLTSTGSITITGAGKKFTGDGSGLTHLNLAEANAYTDGKVAGLLDAAAGDARYLRNTGTIALGGAIRLGTTTTCDAGSTGTLRYEAGHLQLCAPTGWIQVDPAPPPTISSVTPSTGSTAGGTTIVITGTNFTPVASVSVGGLAATTTFVSATELRAATPASPVGGAKTVRVTGSSGAYAEVAGGFTYQVPGLDAASALAHCAAIHAAATGAPSGWYFIKPITANPAFETWCDMTTDGGGWTMVIKGVLDASYDASLNRALKTATNGLGRAYTEMNFADVLVRMGDFASGTDWVAFAGVANGTQPMGTFMTARSFTTNATEFGSTARSASLNGVAEVDRLTFKLYGTGGDLDTGLFVLSDANVDGFNDATAYLTYDGVAMRLKYQDHDSRTVWNTMDQCGACASNQEGYYGGSVTTGTQLGAVFAR